MESFRRMWLLSRKRKKGKTKCGRVFVDTTPSRISFELYEYLVPEKKITKMECILIHYTCLIQILKELTL